jgi:L-fuculose-phosphate aldolase
MKKFIIEIGKKIYDKKLSTGMSGNISFRENNKIFITASGNCLGDLNESDIITLDLEGNEILKQVQDDKGAHDENKGEKKPSSEKMMHVEIYKKRPDINSIIHAHPPYSTALAVSGETDLPAILAEPVVMFGTGISIVKYETPSSLELAQEVAKYFEKNDAVFMANHGAAVCGKDLKETFYKLETLEFYSQVYLFSGMLGKRSGIPSEKIQELMNLRH